MTDPPNFNRERFVEVLTDISIFFRIAKGVTEFYKSPIDEAEGNGEILCDYDNGRSAKIVHSLRYVTPSRTIVKGTVYMAEDEKPMTEEELYHVDVVFRSILSFVSRNRLQMAVEKLAFYDDDDYPNFSYFFRHIEKMQEENAFHGNTAILLNIRQFSIVNREIGRENADVVLKKYYQKLVETIGDDGLVCRVGGDNFITIFKKHLLDEVLAILNGYPIIYDEGREDRVMISASAGVFVIPDDYHFHRAGELLSILFPAAQDAKIEQNGTIVYINPESFAVKEKMLRVHRIFPEALARGEFHAFYQPKVDIYTGKIVGAEALSRWVVKGRVIAPVDYIPVLEQNMDICRLDFHMLDVICRDLRRWLDEGREAVRVSVNLSRKHLIDVDLLAHIIEIVNKYDIPHHYIEIELTETTTDVAFRDLKRIVLGLQEEGFYTSVDDFGVGYSSLNLIREIPWNVLKLDRCFLPTAETEGSDATVRMFKHVVSMVQDMGLECVSEGVETEQQLELLMENNCRIAQGFLFDMPLPVDKFEKKMEHSYYEDK